MARSERPFQAIHLPAPVRTPQAQPVPVLPRVGAVLVLLFAFLLGVKGLGDGFKLLSGDLLSAFFASTENPFVGLVVGLLATTLVQSSSVTTSMIVGLVAAPENPLPLANAIPMVMGANIGTTVTNTVVSLAHMGRREEFRRAFAVATCHDFFNYLSVMVLLPLELLTGYLRNTAVMLGSAFEGLGGFEYESPIKDVLSAGMAPVAQLAAWLFRGQQGQAVFLILVSGLMIFTALLLLVKVMRSAVQTRVEAFISGVLGSNAVVSIAIGAAITIMVQSSSITTSLLVPLAGAGLLSLERAFPVTIGANIGTTVTAFMAALAASGPHATVGVEIAIVHLLFNLSGTVLVYPVRAVRQLPLVSARALAGAAVNSRKVALIYVVALFYGLPVALIVLSRLFL